MLYIVHSWYNLGHVRFLLYVGINKPPVIVLQPIVTGDILTEADILLIFKCILLKENAWV